MSERCTASIIDFRELTSQEKMGQADRCKSQPAVLDVNHLGQHEPMAIFTDIFVTAFLSRSGTGTETIDTSEPVNLFASVDIASSIIGCVVQVDHAQRRTDRSHLELPRQHSGV
jgi:hypothetical protein